MSEATAIPARQLAWLLHGAGVENLGGPDHGPEEIDVPHCGPDELLARIDTCGVCFSDLKIVKQGGSHARLYDRDLAREPVIMGHEPAVTLVQVGENLRDKFAVGERYVVQADIYVNGKSIAFGYMLPGAYEQYALLGEEVLRGDDGCYLLPIEKADTGNAAASLSEPWACCVAAYKVAQRPHFAPGGVVWVAACDPSKPATLGSVFAPGKPPAQVIATDLPGGLAAELLAACSAAGVPFVARDGRATAESVESVRAEHAPDGFGDVVLVGATEPALVEAASKALGRNGTLALIDPAASLPVSIDVGRVHYDYLVHVGSTDGNVESAYASRRGLALKPGGTAWFAGAAGPMGQMHVQLAVERANGPSLVVGTDVDDARLEHLRKRLAAKAEAKGVRLVLFNPLKDPRGLEAAMAELAPEGFDDIVVLAPLAPVVQQCWGYLGAQGVMNVFAGLPKGTLATLDAAAFAHKSARIFGTSGSGMDDLREVLALTESGELDTNLSVAAVGGIDSFRDAVIATQEGRYPGKIVCYPQIRLPLVGLAELRDSLPAVAEKLGPSGEWTVAAERELLKGTKGNG
jgi:L-sorbose 1-phosphate reductase